MELLEAFQYEWAIRALLASSLVGIMCGALGCFIVLRNMALIGDALSHAILPGVVVGFMIAGHSVLAFFTGSIVAGLITAVLITWIQRKVKGKEDAAIGIVFTVMFALGVIGISHLSRKEGVHLDLKDFLFGNVLGVSNNDLMLTAMITVYIALCIVFFYRYFFITTFQPTIAKTMGISAGTLHYFLMLLLSFAVVASLQSVGVILVVAMLIIPASTAYLLTNNLKYMILWSSILGLCSTLTGFVLAVLFETTPGPAMTVVAGFIYVLTIFFAPKKGLLLRSIYNFKKARRIFSEDLLKHSLKFSEQGEVNSSLLQGVLGGTLNKIEKNLFRLSRKGLLKISKEGTITLSKQGQEKAEELLRAHRLWETYLSQRLGVEEAQVHAEAERMEHILTPDLIQEVDFRLGHPTKDPHGSPIPLGKQRWVRLSEALTNSKVKVVGTDSDYASAMLFEKGIALQTILQVIEISSESLHLIHKNSKITLPLSLAKTIFVRLEK